MVYLQGSRRSNVLYNIAKGFGALCHNQSDSHFPTGRMPMGLLEHMAVFFAVDDVRKVCILPLDVVVVYIYMQDSTVS